MASITREDISMLISISNFILTWGVALYMYLANKNKVTNERLTKLEEKIEEKQEDHGTRITSLETLAEFMPGHKDLADMHEKINSATKDLAKLTGSFEAFRNLLSEINSFLRENK